ncbi:membrane hypothetical protein [Azospirillaceae bacterium]
MPSFWTFLSRVRDSNAALTVLVIVAEIFSMGGFASFAMALPELMASWQLTSADGGWISGAYYGGYVLAVPFLVGLTDRIESRRIYVVSCMISAIGGVGFIMFAQGLWSATLFRAVVGVALAGTYMPGLRVLTERLGERGRLRAIPYYTASFGVGVSLSFPICGWFGQVWGWPAAFWAGVIGPVIAAVIMALATRPLRAAVASESLSFETVASGLPARHPLDFRPVFSNRAVLSYVFAYGGHCWELFALRAWMAAFLSFAWNNSIGSIGSIGRDGGGVAWWVSLCVMAGVPASILGAELALHVGRKKLIQRAAWFSVVTGVGAGFATGLPFGVVVALTFFIMLWLRLILGR